MAHSNEESDKKELVFEAQIKSLAKTIFKHCKKESECKTLMVPLEDYIDRVVYYTRIPKETLIKLLDDKITVANEEKSYDSIQRVVIMKALLKLYKNQQPPKFKGLYEAVKHVFQNTNFLQFRHVLSSMGFDYKKTVSGIMIAEDPELAFKRFLYLKKIKKLRCEDVHICFIEERYVNKELNFNKPDFVKDPCYGSNDATHIWDGFYLYHVLSDFGLENHFITNKICKVTHSKWVFTKLLKLLKPGCAIIIDNHPLHGELVDDTVTRYHTKTEMLNWLRKQCIPCSDSMCKAELYELISRCKNPDVCYDFDRLLKANGHEVLRLPTGYKLLSPIPMFWNEVAKRVANLKMTSPVALEETIIPAIVDTHKTVWKEIKEKVMNLEKVLERLYIDTEAALENCEPFDIKNVDKFSKLSEPFMLDQ